MDSYYRETFGNLTVVVIGAGVAGLTAARQLARYGITVHLVEKSKTAGGHAALWACMATDTCQNCGACLSQALVQNALSLDCIKLHLDNEIRHIEKTGSGFHVHLKKGSKTLIKADKIILATGMTPFTPDGLLGAAVERNPFVITTDRLNAALKDLTIVEYFKDRPAPKIAFLQCVGSRNREKGRDFCSQVCCKISLRHINKLLYLYPQAEITMFYMDLQIIGKEARTAFKALSSRVRLVQGVPCEILDHVNPPELTVIREDTLTMTRVADHFDMAVLSVGIQPSVDLPALTEPLNLESNDWGFAVPPEPGINTDILAAGCVNGPKDILTTMANAQACAHQVVRQLLPDGVKPEPEPVAILGNGKSARQAAITVSGLGFTPWIFDSGPKNPALADFANYVPESRIHAVNGCVPEFIIEYEARQTRFKLQAHAVIAAPDTLPDNGAALPELDRDKVFSPADISGILSKSHGDIPQSVMYWFDFWGPESKNTAGIMLNQAGDLAARGRKVTVLMENVLVHGLEGQRLYDDARRKGVLFLRLASQSDVTVTSSGSKILYRIKESTVKQALLELESDWLVIPDNTSPAQSFTALAGLLKEPADSEGRLQAPNIRRRLTGGLRSGIFFTGSGHDDIDAADTALELGQIGSSLLSLNPFRVYASKNPMTINEKKCAKCLTCLRICPHSAIRLQNGLRPFIVPEACFSCGLCMAGCPALAIENTNWSDDGMLSTVTSGCKVILACERSAAIAAGSMPLDDQVRVISVPCACRISSGLVIKCLLRGAAGVLIAGCHEGNCQSDKGSHEGKTIAAKINRIPGITGKKPVVWEPVAANEGHRFAQIIAQLKTS